MKDGGSFQFLAFSNSVGHIMFMAKNENKSEIIGLSPEDPDSSSSFYETKCIITNDNFYEANTVF